MKRLLTVAIPMALALSLSACGGDAPADRSPKSRANDRGAIQRELDRRNIAPRPDARAEPAAVSPWANAWAHRDSV
ncbi:MAG: hypothetical protein AB7S26_23140 [Sandaracinaceae bacterium]